MSGCIKCGKPVDAHNMCKTHYMGWRYRQKGYGKWESASKYTDARPVRDHLLALRAKGLGMRRLEELTGLPRRTLFEVSRRPPKVVEKATAQAILGVALPVKPHDELLAPNALVSSLGTVRRLQALVAFGWSAAELSRRLGAKDPTMAGAYLRDERSQVTVRLARAVDALFCELQLVPGTSVRARNHAVRQGWPPPLAWDEESIDDPDAQPQLPDVRVDFVERYRELREHVGLGSEEIARRLGVKPESLERQLYRWGMAS